MTPLQLIPTFQKGFAWTARLLLKKEFSGIYLDLESAFGADLPWPQAQPLFLFSSHTSWWDPLVAAFLSVHVLGRRTIAPMDEGQFLRYRSLRYVGLFGVSRGDHMAAEQLVQDEITAHPETCVWITPQGAFAPNEVPQPKFKEGLSRWSRAAALQGAGARIPVVIHYFSGMSVRPKVFLRLGSPVTAKAGTLEDGEALRKALNQETKFLLKNVWSAHSGARFAEGAFRKL